MRHFFTRLFVLAALIFAAQAAVSPALAAGSLKDAAGKLDLVGGPAGVSDKADIQSVLASIITGVLTLVGTIFFLLMIYAGFLWMTARGDEGQIDKAKQIISSSIIGIVVVLSAYAITVFVTARFQSSTSATSPGYCSLTLNQTDAAICTQRGDQCTSRSQSQCEANPQCCVWILQ